MITEHDVKKLAELARIRLPEEDAAKLQKDLEEILAYFEKLKAVETAAIPPVAGGTTNENVFRADNGMRVLYAEPSKDFPDAVEGFLKTPNVFEQP